MQTQIALKSFKLKLTKTKQECMVLFFYDLIIKASLHAQCLSSIPRVT